MGEEEKMAMGEEEKMALLELIQDWKNTASGWRKAAERLAEHYSLEVHAQEVIALNVEISRLRSIAYKQQGAGYEVQSKVTEFVEFLEESDPAKGDGK